MTKPIPLSNPTAVSTPYPSAILSWYSTVLLALLYWLSILDRSIISLMVDPIKADLGITDLQFGMLHGMAFAVTFSVFGIAAGALADRYSRRLVVFVSVTLWSLATAACGLAREFSHLPVARVGVGAGEAGLNPAATSMITDLFPPRRLTLALAVYAMGASVGAGSALIFGGMLVDWAEALGQITVPVLGEIKSWQAIFLLIGLPGVVISLLAFSMPEPRRRGRLTTENQVPATRSIFSNYPVLFKFMRSQRQFFTYHYLGFGLASAGFIGGTAWYPVHLSREFGWSGSQIGLGLGGAMIIGGLLGKGIVGFLMDALYVRGYRDSQFLFYSIALLVATPIGIFMTLIDSPWGFVFSYGVFQLLLGSLPAVYISALNLVTPNEIRGTGIAFYAATIGLVAMSVGPLLIAAISEYVFGGDAIGKGIAVNFLICLPLAALILYRGRPSMRAAVISANPS